MELWISIIESSLFVVTKFTWIIVIKFFAILTYHHSHFLATIIIPINTLVWSSLYIILNHMHSYDSWILADACKVIKHKILGFNSKQQVFYYKVLVKAKDGGLTFKTYCIMTIYTTLTPQVKGNYRVIFFIFPCGQGYIKIYPCG